MQLPDTVKGGVVITDLDDDSPAAAVGLQPGDVVVQVNHRPVNTVAEFNSAVKAGASQGFDAAAGEAWCGEKRS